MAIAYRREIDGLRAISVLAVLFNHAKFPYFHGGFVGVDVFFVISGFLITSILYRDVLNGSYSVLNFYEARARRILPSLCFVLFFSLIIAFFLLEPDRMLEFVNSIIFVMLFIANVFFYEKGDYFGFDSGERPMLHTWSLGVEEQFYIVFPILVYFLVKYRPRLFVPCLVIGFFVSLGLAEWLVRSHPAATFYMPITRAWELLAGALAAVYVTRVGLPKPNDWIAFLGLCAIAAAVIFFDEHTPNPSLLTLLPVGGATLVILFGAEGSIASRVLGIRPMVWVGLISYSAYLWHQPIFAFYRLSSSVAVSEFDYVVLLLLVFFLSHLTWKYVETPFRKLRKGAKSNASAHIELRQKQVFLISTFAVSAIIAVAGFVRLTNGLPQRYLTETNALAGKIEISPYRETCHFSSLRTWSPEKVCSYFDEKATWAVWGDSHVVELSYALAEQLREKGEGVKQYSFSQCYPSLNYDSRSDHDCVRWNNRAIEDIMGNFDLQNVVVGYRYGLYFFGSLKGRPLSLPDEQPDIIVPGGISPREALWQDFARTISLLAQKKRRVFVMLPIPEIRSDIRNLIYKEVNSDLIESKDRKFYFSYMHSYGLLGSSYSYYKERNEFVLKKFRETVWPSNVVLFDPTSSFCDRQTCWAIRNGVPMYFDSNHPSLDAARTLAEKLIAIPPTGN
ncbi:acyltransferase family protein [Pseudokordiimonas caeni]|uniref:acyltransferase family protein n=1 Tax=Pseudokordiimonas caeni TaxID=2997908 RepID=UPI0028123074|nr:acyltransferase family protein [Pseudokordiimonas caeni]